MKADLSLPATEPVVHEHVRHQAALLLMFASGFAGLGYQMVWTQQCATWLGHESAAVLAVVAAFFGGLALGALGLGPRIERSGRPLRWYVACELLIGVWGLVLMAVMTPFSAGVLALTGVQPSPAWQWLVAFSGTFLLLLPATAAMGATLPAMERVTAGLLAERRSIAGHYASNTFGAVAGVLSATFWLIPAWGLARTAAVCVGLNLLCAGVALLALPPRALVQTRPLPLAVEIRARRGLLAQLALTGLLGIGYEVLVVRVISQVAEDTVYTFAMLLAVYLVGTAGGAAVYQRRLLKSQDPARLGDRLLSALAMACLLGTISLWGAQALRDQVITLAGGSMAAAVGAEAVLALLAFGLPTLVMGALFSHLTHRASALGISFGRAMGVNTLGAALASPLFGVALAPWLGPKVVLLLLASAYLLLGSRQLWASLWGWAPAGMALAVALMAPPLVFVDVPPGGHIVSYQEGAMAAVSVVEDAEGVARLRINNRQQEGSSATRLVDARQALLPILLHPAPHRALFLGLGTGVTSGSAAQDADLQVDVVELLPEVIEASRHFRRVFNEAQPGQGPHVMAADARRYVRVSPQSYDVIVSDNFQPARSGSGALYTVEHFDFVRHRLAAGGLFCQWLPLHQLDLDTLRSIVKSFLAVYPGGMAILASNSLETPVIGLIGRADGGHFDPALLRQRLARARMPISPAAFGIEDEWALLGSLLAGPEALARFAASAPLNTDDHPVVTYLAPRITYAPDSLPRDRLWALLDALAVTPEEVAGQGVEPEWARRLTAYWASRKRFIEIGMRVQPTGRVEEMLAQVREPLLSVLRVSPDFRPAYDPLVRMAGALAASDEPAARALLTALVRIQPSSQDAAEALRELTASTPSGH